MSRCGKSLMTDDQIDMSESNAPSATSDPDAVAGDAGDHARNDDRKIQDSDRRPARLHDGVCADRHLDLLPLFHQPHLSRTAKLLKPDAADVGHRRAGRRNADGDRHGADRSFGWFGCRSGRRHRSDSARLVGLWIGSVVGCRRRGRDCDWRCAGFVDRLPEHSGIHRHARRLAGLARRNSGVKSRRNNSAPAQSFKAIGQNYVEPQRRLDPRGARDRGCHLDDDRAQSRPAASRAGGTAAWS